jgi:hypothetical protein
MRIRVDTSSLKETTWQQYATRFVLGGLITAGAGLIAKEYGPVAGGLFLSFPAIFPAGATLIEKHEEHKKEEKGLHGDLRARWSVSIDAAGAAIGSIGLLAFGAVVWQFAQRGRAWIVLLTATAIWLAVSVTLWYARKRLALL